MVARAIARPAAPHRAGAPAWSNPIPWPEWVGGALFSVESVENSPICAVDIRAARQGEQQHALRQAHHQVPAGAGRRPEPGARQRQRLHRAAAPAGGAARAGGRRHRRRCSRAPASPVPRLQSGAQDSRSSACRRSKGTGGEITHLARPQQPAQPHRQGSAPSAATSSSPASCSCWRSRDDKGDDRPAAQGSTA